MKLIIATPSPYARKARIALREKGIPCEEIIDNPWLPGSSVGHFNPLGKVPSLILDDGRVVHDSRVIVEYLETLGKEPALIPPDPALRIAHKQIEAIADGLCDAVVLIVLERSRPEALQSHDWIARQRAKIVAATSALSEALGEGPFFTSWGLGLAEVAAGCALGYLDLRFPEYDWRTGHANLVDLATSLSQRSSFRETIPLAQAVPIQK